jgi:hypothetical protein
MYYGYSSNYDQTAEVEIPEDFRYKWNKELQQWEKREDTHVRFHDFGYIEGDTGGSVPGNENSYGTWGNPEDGYDEGYDDITEKEAWLTMPHNAKILVLRLSSDEAFRMFQPDVNRGIFNCIGPRSTRCIEYKGETWELYRAIGTTKYQEKDYIRSTDTETVYRYCTQIGKNGDYSCQVILLEYGTEIFWQWLSDKEQDPSLKWEDCDCQSSGDY